MGSVASGTGLWKPLTAYFWLIASICYFRQVQNKPYGWRECRAQAAKEGLPRSACWLASLLSSEVMRLFLECTSNETPEPDGFSPVVPVVYSGLRQVPA